MSAWSSRTTRCFPHLTVAENVAFGLKARKRAAGDIAPTVKRFLELVHLTDFADRSVRALSGGQQQRVAVARALAVGPKLLLLDEPFSALDRKLRETMQIELRRLLRELGTTSVFVTHDQDEALTMSDRIAVMYRGAIEHLATPEEIYRRPATAFALEFVGLSSRLAGNGRDQRARHGDGRYCVRAAACRRQFRDRRPGPARGAAGAHQGECAGRLRAHRPPARRGVPGLEGPAPLRDRRAATSSWSRRRTLPDGVPRAGLPR